MELVSIITPCYNSEKTIQRCIDSIRIQTYPLWELLIINDGSEDSSKEIILEYCELDERIKLIDNPTNQGIAKSRNNGIKNSKGRFIAFLDSDDEWHKNKLQLQIEHLNSNGQALSCTGFTIVDFDKKKSKMIFPNIQIDSKSILRTNSILLSSAIIDTKKIGTPLFENIKHEDYLYWITIILKHKLIIHPISKNLVNYYQSNFSTSSNKVEAIMWTYNIYRREMNFSFLKSVRFTVTNALLAFKKHYL